MGVCKVICNENNNIFHLYSYLNYFIIDLECAHKTNVLRGFILCQLHAYKTFSKSTSLFLSVSLAHSLAKSFWFYAFTHPHHTQLNVIRIEFLIKSVSPMLWMNFCVVVVIILFCAMCDCVGHECAIFFDVNWNFNMRNMCVMRTSTRAQLYLLCKFNNMNERERKSFHFFSKSHTHTFAYIYAMWSTRNKIYSRFDCF